MISHLSAIAAFSLKSGNTRGLTEGPTFPEELTNMLGLSDGPMDRLVFIFSKDQDNDF